MNNTFGKNIIPDNDEARLAALYRYEILDTPAEGAFDKIAQLAQSIFKVPIALVALVDKDQVFFKANAGMGTTLHVDRGISLCSLAVYNETVTVFENAPDDPCLLHNPLVAGSFGLRFYAGAPITNREGYHLGTVCIVDQKPRSFSSEHRGILQQLADLVMDELELRLSARKAIATQNELLSMAAHDIKNPISNISGLSNLIQMEKGASESIRTYTSLIQKSTETLNKVIQNILDASLRSTGDYSLKLENIDLAKLLLQAMEENKANLMKKKQEIHFQPGKKIKLTGDPLRLKLLFDNLISNASKYSQPGSAIDMQLQKLDGVVRVEVGDQGQGLTETDKENLFGKYCRLSAQPTDRESSTGLGLYIAKKIVDQHKGKIWAESEGKDKGSRFFVELPA